MLSPSGQPIMTIDEYLKTLEENAYEEEGDDYPFVSIFDILDAPRILPEPVDLTYEHLKQVEGELGLIKLCWPEATNPEFEDRLHFPETYTKNSEKEKMLLFTAENFRREFRYKFPNRKQLFLACNNECKIQKMVCTSIRPTTLPFVELEDWKSLVGFFGDHMEYEPLEIATLFPNRLCSPQTTVFRQSGNCFELSTALCSLLLGIGYNAYVVSGYAIQDVTMNIMIRVDSPFPEESDVVEEKKEEKAAQKYTLKSGRDLRSKFIMMMEQRVRDKEEEEQRRRREEELELRRIEEAFPEDDLEGLRIHSWVLMLKGGRKIKEPCFIEPTTGIIHPLNTFAYNGIESVWNHLNYWVNMQECTQDLSTLDYNLQDVNKWEHVLLGEPIESRKHRPDVEADEEEVERIRIYQEKHLDMPISWSSPITIPHDVLASRYPKGVKKTWYKRTLVQSYAPYLQEDGLVNKITRYKDFDCTIPTTTEDTYENRQDKKYKEVANLESGRVEEFFKPGREDCVIKHTYFWYDSGDEDQTRVIEFGSRARYDSLASLTITDNEMTEVYVNKESRLYYRHTTYSRKGFPPPGMVESHKRIMMNVIEKFHRNENVPASKDIAERHFAIYDREIHLRFHYDTGKVTASTRTFIKPPIAEMGEGMKFNPELTYGFHADIKNDPPSNLELFLLFREQLEEEAKSVQHIRDLNDQINDFLKLRNLEVAMVKLEVDLFNREHNEQYRQGMLEREHQERQHKAKETEEHVDYIQPYLERLDDKEVITLESAAALKEWCLNDYKNILLQRAQVIQKRFEKASENLNRKNQWYNLMRDKLKPEEEIQYFEELHRMNFVLQAFVERLERHRELSFYKYTGMVKYLNNHPKLNHSWKKEN
ncbi:dynein regulatory complex subunit 7 isoform X1 [Harmonia axyridis]|uniref:dynein regulatory complex subunit 7 isoform X1 n=2 Tax=Harmonia axyridis TaxID=115357 RepID=UPI001E276AAD|nr:dynein regulatory complex subunit 7 isoform X1 [Harmonia axyridis]